MVGVTVVRPVRAPALGTQRERRSGLPARPCSGADRRWRADAARRGAPISGARRSAADVAVTRPAVAPALCTQRVPRSGFQALHCSGAVRPLRAAAAGGSVIGAAAGLQGFGAPPPPVADPPTRGGHRSAARPTAACPAVTPALRPQPVPREGFRARRCSGAKGPWRAAADRSGPPNSEGSPLGGEADCSASGRRPCSLRSPGFRTVAPRGVLQRG